MLMHSADQLREIAVRLFERVSVPEAAARQVSECIVENCLYGHDSHGMALLPRFIGDIETGKIRPDAAPVVTPRAPAAAVVDGRRGFGPLTMIEAMRTAIRLAETTGVAGVTVTQCNHVGILWAFAKMAADAGMIGTIWCVSGPKGGGGLVAPFGGIRKALGANPIAVAIPAGEMHPFVLDISTSVVAGGKVVLHAQHKKPIPPGWILDEDGRATTDPTKLFKNGDIRIVAGALLPMAGYKGFGLGLAAEMLGGILTGYGTAHRPDFREGNGCFITVVDVKKFVPFEEFTRNADALFRYVKSVPRDPRTQEILIPGEMEFRTRERREREGIPVNKEVWTMIMAAAERLGVLVSVA